MLRYGNKKIDEDVVYAMFTGEYNSMVDYVMESLSEQDKVVDIEKEDYTTKEEAMEREAVQEIVDKVITNLMTAGHMNSIYQKNLHLIFLMQN